MAACFGGWSLDAFDVQIYSVVIPTVIALWEVTTRLCQDNLMAGARGRG
jgi:hypothetical protein